MPTPLLDPRTPADVTRQARDLAAHYVPDWRGFDMPGDPGRMLVDSFVRLMELLIERENRIPDKNLTRFLDLAGVELSPGAPAVVPVTFLLAPGNEAAVVPARTRVAASPGPTATPPSFETTREMVASPARVAKVLSLLPARDAALSLPLGDLPPPPEDLADPTRVVPAFDGVAAELTPVTRVLYLGSEALFGRKDPIDVDLFLSITQGDAGVFSPNLVRWQRYDAASKSWVTLVAEAPVLVAGGIRIRLRQVQGVGKIKLHGRADHFVAARLDGVGAANLAWPTIDSIAGQLATATGSPAPQRVPEWAFLDTSPLDVSKPFLPFGERPRYGHALYLGSRTAFGPEIGTVTVEALVVARTTAQLQTQFAGIDANLTITTVVEWQYLARDGTWKSMGRSGHTLTATAGSPVAISRNPTAAGGSPAILETAGSATFFPGPPPSATDTASLVRFELTFGDDLGLQTVNAQEAYWIRALVRTDNPFGLDGYVVAGTSTTPPRFVGPLLVPPTLESLTLIPGLRPSRVPVSSILTENNFAATDYSPSNLAAPTPFQPFVPLPAYRLGTTPGLLSSDSAIYIGLDQPLPNAATSWFVHLDEPGSRTVSPIESGAPHVAWEYLAADLAWHSLTVEDDTRDLTTSGVLAFLAPADAPAVALFPLAPAADQIPRDTPLHWYRARLVSGHYDHPPRLRGIYLNSVLAENRTVSPDDLLVGSTTGKPGQTVDLVPRNVLEGELWVREPERPSADDLETLRREAEALVRLDVPRARVDASSLVEVRQPGSPDETILVRWLPMPNLLSSGPRSRHFVFDRVHGTLAFGDNRHGLVPPPGRDTLILRHLATGGGEEGNVFGGVLQIRELQSTLPSVEHVFNVIAATGGARAWSTEDAFAFGPQTIKNRGRAVTPEDYEWMVRERFGQIAKIRCLATLAPGPSQSLVFRPGAVTILVVPKGREALPQPPSGLRQAIQDFVRAKALGSIVEEIHVIGPTYQPVSITAQLAVASIRDASRVVPQAVTALENWLHPITGGDDGGGWEFGRDVHLSEVFALLARIPGVDHVVQAGFTGQPGIARIDISESTLTASGTHSVIVT